MSQEKVDEHLEFYHKSGDVRRQLASLREINVTELDSDDIERIMLQHFDMKCDYCNFISKSLPDAQYHYMYEHQIADGYVKCCGHIFKKNLNINGHILWHMNPLLFK